MALLLFPDVNFEMQKGQLASGSIRSYIVQDLFSLIDSLLDEEGKTGMRT